MGNYLCTSKQIREHNTKAEIEPVVTFPRSENVRETGAQQLIVPVGTSRATEEQPVVVTPNSLIVNTSPALVERAKNMDLKPEKFIQLDFPRSENVRETGAQQLIVPVGTSIATEEQPVIVTPNSLIVNTSPALVERAKNMDLKPEKFIQLDMSQVAIKYRCMAPIVIAKRMKRYVPLSKDGENKIQFENCMEDLETAYENNITTGQFKLMILISSQSNGEIRAVIGAYTLYKYDGKPVCDFVLIDISEKRSIDYKTLAATGLFAVLGALIIPGFGPLELAVITSTVGVYGVANVLMKNQVTKECAEAFLFKTLEHYGLIKFLPTPGQIELITQ